MFKQILILTLILFSSPYPVAVLHGFMDSCQNPFFDQLSKLLKYQTGYYSTCIESGGGGEDFSTSFQQQAEKACEEIKNNSNFQSDFSILSVSQGGLLARYIIEKCEMKGTVRKLVSFGGPMMGTSQIPFCLGGVVCYLINSIVDYFVYGKSVQSGVGPAAYFRTAAHLNNYYKSNSFLVNINNEGGNYDENAKKRFLLLEKLVLIGFKDDKMISPKESAEFGVYDENFKVVHMNETEVYKNYTFGLKTLDKQDKILVVYLEGGHINFSTQDIIKYACPNL